MNILWFSVLLLLPACAVAYIGWHLWVLMPFSSIVKGAVLTLCLLCFIVFFLSLSGRLDAMPLPLARVLYTVGTSSLIVILYLFLLFMCLDLGRLVHLVPRSWLYANLPAFMIYSGLIGGLLVYGNIHYNNKVRVRVDMPTSKPLPKDYTIVMASDLHLGYHNDRSTLHGWIDMINAEHPDLILIAGDIIDISVRPLLEEDMAAEFRRLKAPVFACLGNHEYYSGNVQALRFYRDAGITLLSDSIACIDSLIIAGRDDRTNSRRKSVDQLLAGADLTKYVILLDHQPYDLNVERSGVDFQLSGHTHRGQVWPISWVTDKMYECSWGSHQRGATRFYVSSGLGIWGGKFRIGTQSEYVVASLHSSSNTLGK